MLEELLPILGDTTPTETAPGWCKKIWRQLYVDHVDFQMTMSLKLS